MPTQKFSNAEKVAELEYEVRTRHKVYTGLVRGGKMTQELADKRIAIMREIAEEYYRAKRDLFRDDS
jgi:hypothetical protein